MSTFEQHEREETFALASLTPAITPLAEKTSSIWRTRADGALQTHQFARERYDMWWVSVLKLAVRGQESHD